MMQQVRTEQAAAQMLRWQDTLAALLRDRARLLPPLSDRCYSSVEALVLDRGRWFTPADFPRERARGNDGRCYANATRHSEVYGLAYTEGFALAPGGESATLDSLGYIAHHTGDHHQALDHYHHALTLRRTLGAAYSVAGTLDSVGHPHAALGQYEQARAVWREALELYRDQGRDADAERVQHQLDDLDHT